MMSGITPVMRGVLYC